MFASYGAWKTEGMGSGAFARQHQDMMKLSDVSSVVTLYVCCFHKHHSYSNRIILTFLIVMDLLLQFSL